MAAAPYCLPMAALLAALATFNGVHGASCKVKDILNISTDFKTTDISKLKGRWYVNEFYQSEDNDDTLKEATSFVIRFNDDTRDKKDGHIEMITATYAKKKDQTFSRCKEDDKKFFNPKDLPISNNKRVFNTEDRKTLVLAARKDQDFALLYLCDNSVSSTDSTCEKPKAFLLADDKNDDRAAAEYVGILKGTNFGKPFLCFDEKPKPVIVKQRDSKYCTGAGNSLKSGGIIGVILLAGAIVSRSISYF